ncbi:MAG: response regulator transcription factor [Spirochaetota bacterium]
MYRLMLCDDHQIVRHGLRTLLSNIPDITVVGEAASGSEALAMVELERPDILVLDISIGDPDGITVARLVKERSPRVTIIGFSFIGEDELLRSFLRTGAECFVHKGPGDMDELIDALKSVRSGGIYLSPALIPMLLPDFLTHGQGKTRAESLTTRERDILAMVVRGLSSKEIASFLGISIKTIERHRSALLIKANVKNSADLVRWAITMKLVNPA